MRFRPPPRRTLWAYEFHSALHREKLHQANAYGYKVHHDAAKIDWPTLKHKRDKYIERLNGIYERSEHSSRIVYSRATD